MSPRPFVPPSGSPATSPPACNPTDDVTGIAASILDGLLYGNGDAVVGINPPTDNVAQAIKLMKM